MKRWLIEREKQRLNVENRVGIGSAKVSFTEYVLREKSIVTIHNISPKEEGNASVIA